MKAKFHQELIELLDNFDRQKAKELSDRIFEHDEAGGNLTFAEEEMWELLTARIEGFHAAGS